MNEFEKELKIKYIKDEPISKHTSFRVGGNAKYFVYPTNIEEVKELLLLLKKYNLKYYLLGSGSNVVFSSKEYDGVIISTKELNDYRVEGLTVEAYSGALLPKIALETVNNGLDGLSFATGFPASVGGAIYMNAGCYGSDISKVVKDVTFIDDNYNLRTISKEECEFSYRHSIFKDHKNYFIIKTTLELTIGNKEELLSLVKERNEKRRESQPLDKPSAGSVFRNPENNSAGRLIDEAGLKGKMIGGAKVSEKHANFIVNENNATGEDIKSLIELIQKTIKEKYNIDLVLEQELVNF